MANELTFLPNNLGPRTVPLQRTTPAVSEVLGKYVERYKAGLVPQISFAEWEKGVAESKAILENASRNVRRKIERRPLRTK